MRLDRIGIPIRLPSIASCARSILARRFEARFDDDGEPVPLPRVIKIWPRRFLNRQKALAVEVQHPIEIARAAAAEPQLLDRSFDRYKNVRIIYDIIPKISGI